MTEIRRWTIYAVDTSGTAPARIGPIDSGPHRISVTNTSDVSLPGFLSEALGKIRAEQFERARFYIRVERTLNTAPCGDSEERRLESATGAIFHALVILGLIRSAEGQWISGGHIDGRPQVSSTGVIDPHYTPRVWGCPVLDQSGLERAVEIARLLMECYGDGEQGPAVEWMLKVRRGYKALTDGLKAYSASDAIHEFARSLEALIDATPGKTARQMKHRIAMIAGGGSAKRKWESLVEVLFKVRSAVEHLNSVENEVMLDQAESLDEHFLLLRYQAERLACAAYVKILDSHELRLIFSNNDNVVALWKQPEHLVLQEWGDPIPYVDSRK